MPERRRQRWPQGVDAGTNPCQAGFATVLTPDGIRTFDDIDVGSTIWSGQQWTKVIRKIETGIKPVNVYVTPGGHFIGTENHHVSSVPPEGVAWWRALPSYPTTSKGAA